ncbi:MAG: hypothetical protein IT428_25805 [Planctomycetaceae bacterium]|nr:hypothetical protein [Planctomycetaceae bacterium]
MKFLCLGYYDEKKFEAMPKDQVNALVAQCQPFDAKLRESGHMVLVASLGPSNASISIRPRHGQPQITDGPYAETKEQIGAFFLIEAADAAEAVRIASTHPAANLGEQVGWGIEVRPIEYYDQPKAG